MTQGRRWEWDGLITYSCRPNLPSHSFSSLSDTTMAEIQAIQPTGTRDAAAQEDSKVPSAEVSSKRQSLSDVFTIVRDMYDISTGDHLLM